MMKLRNFRTFLVLSATLLFVVYFTLWKFSEKPVYSFKVKIPKPYNPNFTDEEFKNFCLDNAETLPLSFFKKINRTCFINVHSCGTLIVSLSKNSNVKINSQDMATIENLIPLTDKLNEVFKEREENKVFEPNSEKIPTTVVIKSSRSAKYGDVAKVIDAVKSSGADPIVLQIDDLPE